MNAQEVLTRAADYFEDGTYVWIQGRMDDGYNGYCMLGAIDKLSHDDIDLNWAVLNRLKKLPRGVSIGMWNDHAARTKAHVIAALREAAL